MTVFRSRFGRIFSVITWLALGAALAPVVVPLQGEALLRGLPLTALLCFATWAAFWRPRLVVDDSGVHIRNVVTDYDVDWGAIQQVDTKWGLTLFTVSGRITAWAAPAPGRHAAVVASRDQGQHLPESTYVSGTVRPGDLVTSESGAAAAHIRRIWERNESDTGIVHRHLNIPIVLAMGVLCGATALSLSL